MCDAETGPLARFRKWRRDRRWDREMDAPIQGIDPGSNVDRSTQGRLLTQWRRVHTDREAGQ